MPNAEPQDVLNRGIVTAEEIQQILREAKIPPLIAVQLSHILVTDGSGQTADFPIGYACTGYTKTRYCWYRWAVAGGQTAGTNNDAERWGVLAGIDRVLRLTALYEVKSAVHVAVISDSTYTVQSIRDRSSKTSVGWGIITEAIRRGVFVTAYHVGRAILPGNIHADAAAGAFRKLVVTVTAPSTPPKSEVTAP